MLKSNKILNIISIILIFIIIYSIFNNTIYFKKYENFSEVISDFDDEDSIIYKKCPRGCGHHKSVPKCDQCGEDKPDYDKATLQERKWIDDIHLIGDTAREYALNKIENWKRINPDAIFRFTFFYNNTLRSVNIHPNYQLVLYETYNPEKSSKNILFVTKWIEKLQLNLSNYSDYPQIDSTNNWTYIDIEPEKWVDDAIFKIVMENKLASNEFHKTLSKEILDKYNIEIEDKSKTLISSLGIGLNHGFSSFQKKKIK